jgi:hypothetical protein
MNQDPRPHIRRRSHAIDRLRSLTTGAAIAGLAGTAGFGVLAAATWSGDATAANAAGGSTTTNGTTGTNGTGGTSGTNRTTGIAPKTGGTAQQPTVTTPRVQRGSGSGHASTGGSH